MTFFREDNGTWPSRYAKIQEMLDDGKSYAEIGEHFGTTKNAVAGAVMRMRGYVRPVDKAWFAANRKASVNKKGYREHGGYLWNETVLTETWAQRKARRASEKQGATA